MFSSCLDGEASISRKIGSPGANLLKDAARLSSATHSHLLAEVTERAAKQEHPLVDEWDAYCRKNSRDVQNIVRRADRLILTHFATTVQRTWKADDFAEPFKSLWGSKGTPQERHAQYMKGWTNTEVRELGRMNHARSMRALRTFSTWLKSTPPVDQCYHIWTIDDLLDGLMLLGHEEEANLLLAKSDWGKTLAFNYLLIVLHGLAEERVNFDYAPRMKRILQGLGYWVSPAADGASATGGATP